LEAPLHSSDKEIGKTVLDFLFAAQDASTASLTWSCFFLSRYPEVLARVREEQQELRPNDEALTVDSLLNMTYTRQVVKEILRFRAPATLVPHKALKDFTIGDGVKIKKGDLVIPSVLSSSFQGFENPHSFDPDRFSSERREDVKHSKNFLVFGAGPHRCLGYEYAILHLTAFTALFATLTHTEVVHTEEEKEIVYGPTIYPGDGALMKLHPRNPLA